MNKLSFKTELCKGCGLCTGACPRRILALDGTRLNAKGYNPVCVTDMSLCTACAMSTFA